MNEHTRAQVGFAVVTNESAHADRMLEEIAQFVQGATEAVVVHRNSELVHFGSL